MRDAMMADIDDFDLPPPRARRPRAKGPATRTAAASWRGRALAFVHRYPLELLITLALCGAVGAVAYNALALQTSRHPAPLFGGGGRLDGPAPLPPARPALALPAAPGAAAAPAAAPGPARPAARDAIGELIRSGDGPSVTRSVASAETPPLPAARPAPARVPSAPAGSPAAASRDPIADLIRIGGGAPPAPPAFVGKPDPARTVAAGQRALAKLGYGAARVDGVLGPDTRLAIERFERERRLPVTGEFAGRTARELTALSGVAVE